MRLGVDVTQSVVKRVDWVVSATQYLNHFLKIFKELFFGLANLAGVSLKPDSDYSLRPAAQIPIKLGCTKSGGGLHPMGGG